MHTILEVIGWIGSVLVVVSLTQSQVLRFRWMNLTGSVVATFYNAVIEVWPFAAMNGAIAIINIYWLLRLHREASDPSVFKALVVSADNAYLRHVLDEHSADIQAHQPGFVADPTMSPGDRTTLLVVRGDEAVGVVAVRDMGDGMGEVELDWVKPRFRNFTPGQFVYQDSGALPATGFRTLTLTPHEVTDKEYLRRAGFHEEGGRWVRELHPAA